MPENKNPQFVDENQPRENEQQPGSQGQATGTQRQPDVNQDDSKSELAEKNRTGGQTKQPGLPESNDEEWSPGSGASNR